MNLQPPGYEPDELPIALPRDIRTLFGCLRGPRKSGPQLLWGEGRRNLWIWSFRPFLQAGSGMEQVPSDVVPETGVEPARSFGTQDFKSRASTNSATPAYWHGPQVLNYYTTVYPACQGKIPNSPKNFQSTDPGILHILRGETILERRRHSEPAGPRLPPGGKEGGCGRPHLLCSRHAGPQPTVNSPKTASKGGFLFTKRAGLDIICKGRKRRAAPV